MSVPVEPVDIRAGLAPLIAQCSSSERVHCQAPGNLKPLTHLYVATAA